MEQARFVLEDAKNGETEEEISWNNMKQSDIVRNPQLFACSAYGWFRTNPTKNYQDLEKELRGREFDTHLIAVDGYHPNIKYGLYNELAENGKFVELEYCCIFSCRPTKSAIQELLTHWSSYEENFQKLSKAGNAFLSLDDNSLMSDGLYQEEPYSSLCKNKKKLKIISSTK